MAESNRVERPKPGTVVVSDFTVVDWHPTPDPKDSPPQAVCIVCEIQGLPDNPVMIRLKSARVCDELIAALQAHRARVWPVG
jgi:hypothetical protein